MGRWYRASGQKITRIPGVQLGDARRFLRAMIETGHGDTRR